LVVLAGLVILAQCLGDHAQLMVGAGLGVAIAEFDSIF
jgi:hypothetical protein